MVGFILAYFISSYLLCFRQPNKKKDQAIQDFILQYESTTLKRYTYTEIKRMTNSFSDKLGNGGYGSVFKGSLQDGHLVAVKILSETKGNGEDFINEVGSISAYNVGTGRPPTVEGGWNYSPRLKEILLSTFRMKLINYFSQSLCNLPHLN